MDELARARAHIALLQAQLRAAGIAPAQPPEIESAPNKHDDDDALFSSAATVVDEPPTTSSASSSLSSSSTAANDRRRSRSDTAAARRASSGARAMVHSVSPVEAAMIHEPTLLTRAWWQPAMTRAEADAFLLSAHAAMSSSSSSSSSLSLDQSVDNWSRSPDADAAPLAVVRHSSSDHCLALSWFARKHSRPRVSHALIVLVCDDDGSLDGYSCDLGDFEVVDVRTLSELVAHVLPQATFVVDASRLFGARGPPTLLEATAHRWSTVGDLAQSLARSVDALLPAEAALARHVALMMLVRDARVMRAVLDALAVDRRGLAALASVFVRHGIATELLDVALSGRGAASDGPWTTAGAVRPGGAVAATLLTCIVQATCGAWLRPLLGAALDAVNLKPGMSDGDVLTLAGTAVLAITRSPPSACPPLVRSVVATLATLRPQAGDDRAFFASLCVAPFIRAFASGAIEASPSGQGAAHKLMRAASMVSLLGDGVGTADASQSTWRLWAPPIEAAIRAFCQQLVAQPPQAEEPRQDFAFGDTRAACALPRSSAVVDALSVESLRRALAPCAVPLLAAVRGACAALDGFPDAAVCEALAPMLQHDRPRLARIDWAAVDSLLREPLAIVDRCRLRIAVGTHMYAGNDVLLAALVRPADTRALAALLHSLRSSHAKHGADNVMLLRDTRAFPPSGELSQVQFEVVLAADEVEYAATRRLLQRVVANNDAEHNTSVALLAAMENASDSSVVRFRRRTAELEAARPSRPPTLATGVALRRARAQVRPTRLERDIVVTLWLGAASATVRVAPQMSAADALRGASAELGAAAGASDNWALKLAFNDAFIVGDERRVPLCDFAAIRELVLDGRAVVLLVLLDFDARGVDGSAAARAHLRAFADAVEARPRVARGDASSVRVIGERQKFECNVNEVAFFDGGAADDSKRFGAIGLSLSVELTLEFGGAQLSAPRRTAALEVRAGHRAALASGVPVPLGVLEANEWLVGAAHLGQLPFGTLLHWRLVAGATVLGECLVPLYDADGWLSQGRHVHELALSESAAALRGTRAFLAVTLLSFLGDPNLPRVRVYHPQVDDVESGTLASVAGRTEAMPSADERRALAALDATDCLRRLSDDERSLFRRFRAQLSTLAPQSLARVVDNGDVFDWSSASDVDELHAMVHTRWPTLDVRAALLVLQTPCADLFVRRRAVRALQSSVVDDDALVRLLPQLVECLRLEQHDESALLRFLMARAALAPLVVGVALVFKLRVDICYSHRRPTPPCVAAVSEARMQLRFALYVERLLAVCGGALVQTLEAQMQAIESLEALNQAVKPLAYGAKRSEALARILSDTLVTGWPKQWRLPFDGAIVAGRPSVSRSRAMDSHQCPLRITFPLIETTLGDGGPRAADGDVVSIIFKIGDDVRQDECVIQMLCLLQDAWDAAAVESALVLYRSLAVGLECGMIECVTHCSTIAKIQASRGGSIVGALRSTPLYQFLTDQTPVDAADADKLLWRDVLNNYTRSLAASCVATFALGIGDRHNDNVMLRNDGRLFHIDFGHVLGNFKTLERASCALTKEMAFVLGGEDTAEFAAFVQLAVRAFNVARTLVPWLVCLLAGLMPAGLRELREEADVLFVRSSLNGAGDVDDEQRELNFRKILLSSLGTFSSSRVMNLAHLLAHQKSVKETK